MPLVLLDTSVTLPATLSEPGGVRRKLMMLLAYGALVYREEHLGVELDALQREAENFGGEVFAPESIETLKKHAQERRAALGELLPYGTTSEFVAIGSAPLFDEYLRKVVERGPEFGRDIGDDEARAMLARWQAICVHAAPWFDLSNVPRLTSDAKDDPIVYSALLGGADFIVSDDRHIVPKLERPTAFHEHGEMRVMAMTFSDFLAEHLSDVDWDEIDGALLGEAFQLVAQST